MLPPAEITKRIARSHQTFIANNMSCRAESCTFHRRRVASRFRARDAFGTVV